MAKQPYFPFFVGDWLKDANLNLCSPESRGVWLDFICAMHELRSGGVLTGNKDQLCRVGRCSHAQLDRSLIELQTTGTADISERNGIYAIICRRMRRESERREKRAASGSVGGSKRQANLKQNSDSDIEVEIESEEWMKSPEFQHVWIEWNQHREAIGKPSTGLAKLKQIQQCKAIGKDRAIRAINHSIANGWQGIYEPKPQQNGHSFEKPRQKSILERDIERQCKSTTTVNSAPSREL